MKFLKSVAACLDSDWFFVLFIGSIIGAVLWAGGVFASWPFQNPTDRLDDAQVAYSEWEEYSSKNTRFLQETLFIAHCSAIDKKNERGEQIQDVRYVVPCENNDIELYFKIRAGFTTVQ